MVAVLLRARPAADMLRIGYWPRLILWSASMMRATQEQERQDAFISTEPSSPPVELLEGLEPLNAEDKCELFGYFFQAVDEFSELAPEDVLFLETHLADCPTGKHSEAAFEDALNLPRHALRKGSLEHGLSSPKMLIDRINTDFETFQQINAADSGGDSEPPASKVKGDLSGPEPPFEDQYPGEYLVLQGREILCHSKSRREAFDAYDQAYVGEDGCFPVLVVPDRQKPEITPVFRGRSLTK